MLILSMSIGVRVLAMLWSIYYLYRLRDWRMGFLTAMLFLMALRQSLTLNKLMGAQTTAWSVQWSELPGFVVSLLALAAVGFLGTTIQRERLRSQRLSVTLRSLTDAVIALGSDGCVTDMNLAAEELAGHSEADVRGRPLHELLTVEVEDDASWLESAVRQVLTSGEVLELRDRGQLVEGDGPKVSVDVRCAPLLDARRRSIGAVVIIHDTTERRHAEREQIRAARMDSLRVLAGGLAHDFNNLLNAILGSANLVRSGTSASETDEFLGYIEDAAIQARDVTRQFSTFARGGAPVTESTTVNRLIENAARLAVSGHPCVVEFDLAEALTADVDAGQISQVIHNLVLNACQAMPDGGRVEVRGRTEPRDGQSTPGKLREGSYVRIEVRDHGPGVPPELQDRIFDPYFTTKATGTGLGLASAQSIIQRHGGHIDIDGSVREGTCVRLWLPSAETSAPSRDDSEDPSALTKAHILVMDDDPRIRTVLARQLGRLGCSVVAVADGKAAVATFEESQRGQRFDAVIMDLMIRGSEGGAWAIKQLHALDPAVRVICSSGYSADMPIAEWKEHGFAALLPKPYTLDELRDVLDKVLRRARPRSEG